ncbi:MAG: hypothetical protein ACI9HK_001154 [Pirellulaceae bacterium]|jgi:hypothetical protein
MKLTEPMLIKGLRMRGRNQDCGKAFVLHGKPKTYVTEIQLMFREQTA